MAKNKPGAGPSPRTVDPQRPTDAGRITPDRPEPPSPPTRTVPTRKP
jgi:hypothetical protein